MPKLSKTMTEKEFDNGYWYAEDLKDFAADLGIPSAGTLRKDQLEKAIKQFIRTGRIGESASTKPAASGVRDIDKGLRLDMPIVHYVSNKETKAFIAREMQKMAPGMKRVSGSKYLLNRWREEQIARGKRITYRDLIKQAISLNKTKKGPLRVEHGRYINFISDYMKANKGAAQNDAVKAWGEVKKMDAPKTYASWAKAKKR